MTNKLNRKDIKTVISRYSVVQSSFMDYQTTVEQLYEQCCLSIDSLLDESVYRILGETSIDVINKGGNRFCFTYIKELGYTSILDIIRLPDKKLASFKGIRDYKIGFLREEIEKVKNSIRQQTRIQLSVDNKTKASTNLVLTFCKYFKSTENNNIYNELVYTFTNEFSEKIDELNYCIKPSVWYFLTRRKKSVVLDYYNYVNNNIGELELKIKVLKCALDNANKIQKNEAWNHFTFNSIDYITMIERIDPKAFGSEYENVLPKHIAEKITSQNIKTEGLNCNLREYQKLGVKFILCQEKVLLGDEMGLGKTVQAIAAMVSLRNSGCERFVVMTPASVLINWSREIEQKSNLQVHVIWGKNKIIELEEWKQKGGVAIITHDFSNTDELTDTKIDMVIFDEAHYIKNAKTNRSKAAAKLFLKSPRILLMTGTSLENKRADIITLINYLNPSLASKLKDKKYIREVEAFREAIAPFYFRRKREQVLSELPDLIEVVESCSMTDEEKSAYYNSVLNSNGNYLTVLQSTWEIDNINNSSKALRLKEIVEEARNEGRKIIVYSYFLNVLKRIVEIFGVDAYGPLDGSVPSPKRQVIIDEFSAAPEGSVLVAQIVAGGIGLNIQSASTVIICEPQVKPSIESQAISRSYRMGQVKNVLVYRLVYSDENVIERKMMEILQSKKKAFDDYADKSASAELLEVDTVTMDKILRDEAERVKSVYEITTEKEKEINHYSKPIAREFLLAEKNDNKSEVQLPFMYSFGQSVTQVISGISQPKGGYANIKTFSERIIDDGIVLSAENIPPTIMGIVVDYLTRFMIGESVENAFSASIKGYRNFVKYLGIANDEMNIQNLLSRVKGLDDDSIISACKAAVYDVWYRNIGAAQNTFNASEINPDYSTISNIRIMVARTVDFLKKCNSEVVCGFKFAENDEDGELIHNGYTLTISDGEGDYLTSDTMWDLKVSKKPPDNKQSLQLLMYWIMGQHSGMSAYKSVTKIGIFNPRLNKSYVLDVSDIPKELIHEVETKVIGY